MYRIVLVIVLALLAISLVYRLVPQAAQVRHVIYSQAKDRPKPYLVKTTQLPDGSTIEIIDVPLNRTDSKLCVVFTKEHRQSMNCTLVFRDSNSFIPLAVK